MGQSSLPDQVEKARETLQVCRFGVKWSDTRTDIIVWIWCKMCAHMHVLTLTHACTDSLLVRTHTFLHMPSLTHTLATCIHEDPHPHACTWIVRTLVHPHQLPTAQPVLPLAHFTHVAIRITSPPPSPRQDSSFHSIAENDQIKEYYLLSCMHTTIQYLHC